MPMCDRVLCWDPRREAKDRRLPLPKNGDPIDTVQDLRVELLRITDELIGARAELAISRGTIADRDEQIVQERAERAREVAELRSAYESSTRWRIGSRVVRPVELIRQGLSR